MGMSESYLSGSVERCVKYCKNVTISCIIVWVLFYAQWHFRKGPLTSIENPSFAGILQAYMHCNTLCKIEGEFCEIVVQLGLGLGLGLTLTHTIGQHILWCLFKTESRKPSIVHFYATICHISFVISIWYCTCVIYLQWCRYTLTIVVYLFWKVRCVKCISTEGRRGNIQMQ